MPIMPVLQEVLLLLLVALGNAWLFSWLRMSPIIGYLVSGMIVGPYGLHLMHSHQQVEVMAELGVILLLFTIGLEFSFSRIIKLKGLLLRCGLLQVGATTALVWLILQLMGLPLGTAAALGMAFALSSTAIVLKMLLEKGLMDTPYGRICLAILLFQDLCVVLFILILPLLAGGQGDFSWLALARAGLILGGLYLFARYALHPLIRSMLRTRAPELFRLTILALVMGTAWLTAEAGLSLALGAFVAGLALAESEYAHQVLADIIPFRDAFLALFFISIGMLVDVSLLMEYSGTILLGLLLLSVLKVVVASVAAKQSGYHLKTALLSGIMLFQVGEFSFVLLKQALDEGVLATQHYQMALSIVALSMLLTPMVLSRAEQVAGWLTRVARRKAFAKHLEEEAPINAAELENHIIVAGYGVSGQNVSKILRQVNIPYIPLELNYEVVQRARSMGERIVYGDVAMPEVLTGVGLKRARALVLCLNDPAALARAVRAARTLRKDIYILARTRFVKEIDYLTQLGADEVVPDEFEASLQLGANLLRRFQVPEGQTLKLLSGLRHEHYEGLRTPMLPPATLGNYLSLLEGGQVEFQAVPHDSPWVGRTLAELELPHHLHAMIVGVLRDDKVEYAPQADYCLAGGDILVLLGNSDNLPQVRELLHGHGM